MSRSRISTFLNGIILLVILMGPVGYYFEHEQRMIEQDQFRDSLLSARVGRWVWNLEAETAGLDSLFWDDQMFIIFGRDKKKFSTNYGGFQACLLASDRQRIRSACDHAIAIKGGYEEVFSVVWDDGSVHMIRASGKVSKDGKWMNGICIPSMQENEDANP